MTAVISSQPLLRVCEPDRPPPRRAPGVKLTEMNAPIAMMKTMTPTWPKTNPTVSVSTNSVSGLNSP